MTPMPVADEHRAFRVQRLLPEHAHLMPALLTMFGKAFEDEHEWSVARPDAAYLAKLLTRPDVIVLAALKNEEVVGGLVAYDLPKIEQARSEIYIYDLAVDEAHRRQGIASALIEALQPIARECGAWCIFVQAEAIDADPIALYSKLGQRMDVLHFDIPVRPAALT
jgi:aminoglycoside 3-N-acetyltransferase I